MTETELPRYDLDVLVAPRSVALYGVSERTSAADGSNLQTGGRPLIGVHPVHDEVLGIRCVAPAGRTPASSTTWSSWASGTLRIEGAVDDVIAAGGTRVVIVPGLGSESGHQGAADRRPHRREAGGGRHRDARRRTAWASRRPRRRRRGSAGSLPPSCPAASPAVVQSGSLGSVLVGMGPRTGFRTVISTGAEDDRRHRRRARLPGCRRAHARRRAVHRGRAPAGRVRGGPAADGRGRQARDRAEGRHVGRRGPGRARAHRRAGGLRPQLLRRAPPLRRDPRRRRQLAGSSTWSRSARTARRRGTRIGAITASGGEGEHVADVAERDRACRCPTRPRRWPAACASGSRTSATSRTRSTAGPSTPPTSCSRRSSTSSRRPASTTRCCRSPTTAAGRTGPINDHYAGILHDLVPRAENGLYPVRHLGDDRRAVRGRPALRATSTTCRCCAASAPASRPSRRRLAFAPVVPPPRAVPGGRADRRRSGPLPELESAQILAAHGIPSARAIRCATPRGRSRCRDAARLPGGRQGGRPGAQGPGRRRRARARRRGGRRRRGGPAWAAA